MDFDKDLNAYICNRYSFLTYVIFKKVALKVAYIVKVLLKTYNIISIQNHIN